MIAHTVPKAIIVALDFSTEQSCCALLDQLDPSQCRVKIGKELFTSIGPNIVRRAIDSGFDVFLDLKFHDIPNTVAAACRAAADLGVWMVNVHASGGRQMMEAAREELAHLSSRPLLVAVTVLTSLDDSAVRELGFADDTNALVKRLARLSHDCGVDGVVCSPHEIRMIKECCSNQFLAVTPGVRPKGSDLGDQRRVATPSEAFSAGADFLVIGRPISRAADCAAALTAIYSELRADHSAENR
ncbi:MAG: orotidine-5'-phosphate decarboxylase [Gammaproteobacteria bacterium]|jgi:orotidine-5'-phosphate decarboxylase